jgi:TolA-binding protein
MIMPLEKKALVVACSFALGCVTGARADQISDMQQKLDALQRQVQELQTQIGSVKREQEKREQSAPPSGIAMKPGNDLTFRGPALRPRRCLAR